MKIRLTESDLKNIIYSTVEKILKEEIDNNSILSRIVDRLSNMDVSASNGSNSVEVPLDDQGNVIAFIDYEINDKRYLNNVEAPDGPLNDIEGDFELYITDMVIYDENDNETPIEDNGMVTNALKELVNLDDSDLDYAIEDDQSGWNDLWK
jgi:hypothetical protein